MTGQINRDTNGQEKSTASRVVDLAFEARSRHSLFQIAWSLGNILLAAAFFFALYAGIWEYSTQRYLTGFSNAIVPATASDEDKIQAILSWMNFGPTRLPYNLASTNHDRDPTDTLNYDALLSVCGTATNAFINLADTAHLRVRRLLLLDNSRVTKHVVAEVFVNTKWIIVDPAYRTILRDKNGHAVTREDLLDPEKFSDVTKGIKNYLPEYSFENTVHVRVGGLPVVGRPIGAILNRFFPGWEASTFVTLLVERESLAAEVTAILLLILMLLFRSTLRWYAEHRLNFSPVFLRDRARLAVSAFIRAPES
jgi:hypothetical protein